MKDADLLQYCRYYKGERRNPYEGKDQNKMMLWSYEQIWADMASGNTLILCLLNIVCISIVICRNS